MSPLSWGIRRDSTGQRMQRERENPRRGEKKSWHTKGFADFLTTVKTVDRKRHLLAEGSEETKPSERPRGSR
jgi:hypothetical protein